MTNPESNPGLSAALKGATLAFNGQKTDTDKPKAKPRPVPRTPKPKASGNEALQAASQASRDHGLASPSSPSLRRNSTLSRQTTGGSVREFGPPSHGFGRELEHGAVSKKLSQYLGSSPLSPQHLSPPGARPSPDNRSASFIAATLAASRSGSASPSPHHTGHAPTPQPGHSPLNPTIGRNNRYVGMASANSSMASLDLPDTTSIPPTNSLVSMFEKQTDDADLVQTPRKKHLSSPAPTKLGSTPKKRAMTPPRSISPSEQWVQPQPEVNNTTSRQERQGPLERSKTPPQIIRRAATEIVSPEPRKMGPKPILQPPAVRPGEATERSGAAVKPTDPTPTRRVSIGSVSSNDTFVSASSRASSPMPDSNVSAFVKEPLLQPNMKPAPVPAPVPLPPKPVPPPPKPRTLRKASSMTSVQSHPTGTRRPVATIKANNINSNLPLDSLTSAMMASNLASARHVPSPAPPPPVPAPRRSGKTDHHHKHHLYPRKKHHTGDTSTSLQRAGTLLTTLRRPRSASDDEDFRLRNKRHGKHTLRSGKGKHAHHEGARKRWRDEVSPRERKRYEAVWASNRGQFYTQSPASTPSDPNSNPSQLVINIVVRDIWSRSRLPFDELAEVWDLVYRNRNMGLNREEFVVGMWLIDQRLRGRKIPARVSDSVWDSTRGMRVKMPKGKKK